MSKISYDDKTNIKPVANRSTQATAEDFNQIKESVNTLYDTKQDSEIGKGLSSNDFTNDDKTKLDGIEANAEVNVQSDWEQTNILLDDYILNKPTTISAGITSHNDLINRDAAGNHSKFISTANNSQNFQFLKQDGTSVVMNIDTLNSRLGIGTASPTSALHINNIVEYADNATALLAGLTSGAVYRTGDILKIVH